MTGTLDIIKKIICSEMQIPLNRVFAYNSNVDLPQDTGLFIVLHYGTRNPTSNTIKYVETANGVEEHQSINVCEEVIISLLSQNTEARERSHEPHMAMNSTFSRNLQFKEHIHISIIGDVYDASFLEATSRINRFDCKIRVFKSYEKIKPVDYYDKFNFEVWTGKQDDAIIKEKFNIGDHNGDTISDTD